MANIKLTGASSGPRRDRPSNRRLVQRWVVPRCSLLATNSKLIKLKAQKVTWVRTNQRQHNLEVDSLRCRFTLPLWSKVRKKLRFLAYDEQLRWMYDVKLTSTSALTAGTEKACS